MKSEDLQKKMTLLEFGDELVKHFTKYGFTEIETPPPISATGNMEEYIVTMVPKSVRKDDKESRDQK